MDAEGVFALLTPQEVSGHAFTKAVMGGYNMAMVDEFLDELTDDYTALYKENAALKAKLKVLVEKVEDYRATEDSMRATLLTAQKMADSIVREAEAKRDQLLRDAETQAQEKICALRREAEEAQERLRAGQREIASFSEKVRAVCQQEIQFLDQLPQAAVDAREEPEPDVPAREIEEKIMDTIRQEAPAVAEAFAPETIPAQAAKGQPVPESSPRQEEQPPISAAEPEQNSEFPYPEGNPFVPMADEPPGKIELDELKFGRNYNRSE
ncbi:putative cell division protein [Oscillibacter valericigenes Sjm18-20]|nr:putative cell division protein [Oscillibacter valericigenes Sjm18-20]